MTTSLLFLPGESHGQRSLVDFYVPVYRGWILASEICVQHVEATKWAGLLRTRLQREGIEVLVHPTLWDSLVMLQHLHLNFCTFCKKQDWSKNRLPGKGNRFLVLSRKMQDLQSWLWLRITDLLKETVIMHHNERINRAQEWRIGQLFFPAGSTSPLLIASLLSVCINFPNSSPVVQRRNKEEPFFNLLKWKGVPNLLWILAEQTLLSKDHIYCSGSPSGIRFISEESLSTKEEKQGLGLTWEMAVKSVMPWIR